MLVLDSRPDTERNREEFYSKLYNLNFVECSTCATKPGSPILCDACLHNRQVIETLKAMARIR